jgi:hypothetical protein
MFMTQEHAEEQLGKPFGPDHFWRWVEFSHEDVWYFVIASYQRDTGKAFRYYFLTKPSDLVNLIGEVDEEFWIEQVMAVIPPHMNGNGCWEMHRLRELLAVSTDTDLINLQYEFRLEGDLVYGPQEPREGSVVMRRQVLFSEKRHASTDDREKW